MWKQPWTGSGTLSLKDSPNVSVGVEECLTNKAWLTCWNHKWRGGHMMVCALIQISPTDGCSKGWDFFLYRGLWCQYSLVLSLFSTRRKWRGRSSNVSVSLSREKNGVQLGEDATNGQREWKIWLFLKQSFISYASASHSDLAIQRLSTGGRQNSAFPHSPLMGKKTVADDVAR